jgi:hypothetical protein
MINKACAQTNIDFLLASLNNKGLYIKGWGIAADWASFMPDYHYSQLVYMADMLERFDGNRIFDKRYYWYMAWLGLTRDQVKAWKTAWPNYTFWPPSNPAPSEDSTRGLKYALTLARIDSIHNIVLENEEKSKPGALGRKPVSGDCY